ncbi:hypothetical protein B0F90DRAFT_1714720 [Multifurca ochricompacta]|uniref:Uncharacterized protein n=1 Tax=Multifurca ochricompacta TaxID=376703 RepID=A0AAD4M5N8_9AGAM|nr:hypothetical protein B0F90DRAFT_1714720 [Multifurca ochricompacta]
MPPTTTTTLHQNEIPGVPGCAIVHKYSLETVTEMAADFHAATLSQVSPCAIGVSVGLALGSSRIRTLIISTLDDIFPSVRTTIHLIVLSHTLGFDISGYDLTTINISRETGSFLTPGTLLNAAIPSVPMLRCLVDLATRSIRLDLLKPLVRENDFTKVRSNPDGLLKIENARYKTRIRMSEQVRRTDYFAGDCATATYTPIPFIDTPRALFKNGGVINARVKRVDGRHTSAVAAQKLQTTPSPAYWYSGAKREHPRNNRDIFSQVFSHQSP